MARSTSGYGWALLSLGAFAACSSDTNDSGGSGNRAGASGSGTSGASSGGAASGASGAASIAGSGGASGGATSGTSGASGASNAGGVSGAAGGSGASHAPGGAAGRTLSGGASGATSGRSGAPAEGGSPGEGGETGEGGAASEPVGLSWPIDCVPGDTCVRLGYPDLDDDGAAHDCSNAGYVGHEGTDIDITPEAMAAGTAVRAAADGVVVFAFDGKFDQCPSASEPDCQDPSSTAPGSSSGTTVCTPIGPYCGTGDPGCYWCFAGGNVIVIRHQGVPGVFATRYDHLKKSSVLVQPGDTVTRGQKIAEAGSAGSSTTPHLHFEVWGTGFYELADPWSGTCGPNFGPSLWAFRPPWSEE